MVVFGVVDVPGINVRHNNGERVEQRQRRRLMWGCGNRVVLALGLFLRPRRWRLLEVVVKNSLAKTDHPCDRHRLYKYECETRKYMDKNIQANEMHTQRTNNAYTHIMFTWHTHAPSVSMYIKINKHTCVRRRDLIASQSFSRSSSRPVPSSTSYPHHYGWYTDRDFREHQHSNTYTYMHACIHTYM